MGMAPVNVLRKLSDSEEAQVLRMMERSRVQMLLNWSFFAILAMHLILEVDYRIPTAATDGDKLYYNPHFIKNLKESQRNWIVAHEVLHPALKHLWRRNNREMEKWNFACDYAIHCIMVQFVNSGNSAAKAKMEMPAGVLYNPEYDNMTAEEIYNKLPNDYKKQAKFGNGAGQGQGQGQQGQGQSQPGQGQGQGQGHRRHPHL